MNNVADAWVTKLPDIPSEGSCTRRSLSWQWLYKIRSACLAAAGCRDAGAYKFTEWFSNGSAAALCRKAVYTHAVATE